MDFNEWNDLHSVLQFKQLLFSLRRKKDFKFTTRFESMTSAMPVRCFTNEALRCWKQIEFGFQYPIRVYVSVRIFITLYRLVIDLVYLIYGRPSQLCTQIKQLWKESLKKFRPDKRTGFGSMISAIPVQSSYQLIYQTNWELVLA